MCTLPVQARHVDTGPGEEDGPVAPRPVLVLGPVKVSLLAPHLPDHLGLADLLRPPGAGQPLVERRGRVIEVPLELEVLLVVVEGEEQLSLLTYS